MHKHFNLRFTVWLFASLVVLGTATHFVHAYQVRRTAETMLDRASRAETDGQLDQAADYLGRYIALNPDKIDVLARYGALLADDRLATSDRARSRAWLVLNKVLYREPDRLDVRRQAVRVAIALRQFAGARADLEKVLLPASPHDGELNSLLGRCHEALGNYPGARKCYEESVRDAPHDVDGFNRLARLLRTQTRNLLHPKEEPDDALRQADRVMDEMVSANDRSFRAYLLRAAYRKSFGGNLPPPKTLEAAGKDIARARELAPDEVEVVLAAAELARDQQQSDDARRLLRQSRDRHPKDWRMHLAAARLEARSGRTDAALDCLRAGLKELPNQIQLQRELADLLTAAGRKDEAREAIDRLEKMGVPAGYLDCLNGRLRMQDGLWQKAIEKLETAYSDLNARTNQPEGEMAAAWGESTGLLLGQCFEQVGDSDAAYEAYARVVGRHDESVPGRRGMATSRWNQGKLQEALEQYRLLVRLPETAGDWVDVARLLLALNAQDPARYRSEAEQALRNAEALNPLPPSVAVLRAEFWAAQGEVRQARAALLGRFGEPKTRPSEVWVALAALEDREGRAAEAVKLLDEAERHIGDRVDLRLARVRHWLRQGQTEARKAIAPLLDGVDKFSAADRRRLLQGLAAAYVQVGLTEEARRLWGRLADEEPSDLRSRIALFDLAAQAGDVAAMEKWQVEIRRIEGPNGLFWRFARACALARRAQGGADADQSGLTEARNLLAAVKARRPTWSRVFLYEARLDDIAGHPEVALPLYLQAIKLGEQDPTAVGRAIVLLHERRRDDEANQLLGGLPKETLLPEDTQRVAAEVALRSQDKADALARAERAVAADSKDYHDHLWLGYMRWATGQVDRAEPALLRARDLNPAAPEVWTTLVQFLVTTGRKDRAVAEVAAASRHLTTPSALAALAQCHEVVAQRDRARDLYESALRAAGNDPVVLRAAAGFFLRSGEPRRAEELLQNLIRHSDGLTRVWARRVRAYALVAGGSPAKVREALALLDDASTGIAAPPGSAEAVQDQRARAQLLALQSDSTSRRGAIGILDGLIERRVAAPEDYLLAAHVHESLGDWPHARQRYLGMFELPTELGPDAVVAAARSFVRHGEEASARQALRRLEGMAGQEAAVQEVRARLLHLQGRKREAADLVRTYARSPGADLAVAAKVLEEFDDRGSLAGAEELYRAHAAKADPPQNALALAHFLIRRGRVAEALDLCDRSWQTCRPIDVAQACVLALSKLPPTSDQFGRVSDHLEAEIARTPADVNLIVSLAAVRNYQARFDEAVALYRRVLQKDGGHYTALNNLAWLLALQGGHGQEAVALADRAAQEVGPVPGLLDTRAVAFLTLGRRETAESAVRDLERVVADAPSPTAFFHLARAYDQLGRRSDAAKAWQAAKAQGLNPDALHPLERDAYGRLAGVLN